MPPCVHETGASGGSKTINFGWLPGWPSSAFNTSRTYSLCDSVGAEAAGSISQTNGPLESTPTSEAK